MWNRAPAEAGADTTEDEEQEVDGEDVEEDILSRRGGRRN